MSVLRRVFFSQDLVIFNFMVLPIPEVKILAGVGYVFSG